MQILKQTAFLAVSMTFLLVSQNAFAQSVSGYEAGVAFYKNRNYSAAIKSFESEIKKGDAKAEVYTYLGHSYYAMGDRIRALKSYQEIMAKFKGQPAEQSAKEFIKRLDPHGRYSQTRSSSVLQRIEVIAPTVPGHPPVESSTVSSVRSALLKLPAYVLKILDNNGTTIYVGTNSTDKFPEDWRVSKPGLEAITLSQEPGRTIGSDIYIWERPTEPGSKELSEKFPDYYFEHALLGEVGHVVAKALNDIASDPGFKEKYDLEVGLLSSTEKKRYDVFLQKDNKGAEELAAACVASVLRNSSQQSSHFSKCEDWVKQRMEAARTGRVSLLVSLGPNSKKDSKQPKKDDKTQGIKTATATGAAITADAKLEKLKKEKPDVIPEQDHVPFWIDVHTRMRVKGWINGRPTTMMLDTGAYKVVIGWETLQQLGIKTPEGKATERSSGAGGSFEHWEMPIEIQIGKIKRTVNASVVKNEPEILVGQPFLEGLSYRIDTRGSYIHFVKKGGSAKHVGTFDSIEVPYRMANGNMMVQAKINNTPLEMNFDTGAPTTVLSMQDAWRLGLMMKEPLDVEAIGGVGGAAQEAYVYRISDIQLESKKMLDFRVHVMNIGHSVLGQDFFGSSQFVVDSEKRVIRFTRR